ncbi:GntR family transcriptional regulator [Micromonospora taraxaci]|uniref:GntR family transcriptional regulator n=1 Tax=Micromonospora taraxaci TaxID=1316803 RepID=UPI0033F33E4F
MPTPHYGQPRYRAIAEELRRRMEDAVIPPGTLLPTEGALAAEFRAARGTIRRAISLLREAGLVATEHGRGTYSNVRPIGTASSRSSESETRQREVAANPELAALFAVKAGTALIELESVARSNGDVVVTRIYRLVGPPDYNDVAQAGGSAFHRQAGLPVAPSDSTV